MSASAQVQAQVDAAVQAALAPLIRGLAELTERVSQLEHPATPRKTAARAQAADVKGTAPAK